MAPIRFGILTVSDTCYNGEKVDESGPTLIRLVSDSGTETGKVLKGHVICTDIVKDDERLITERLASWSDSNNVDVILTTGGTGFSARDVTPEATKKIIDKEAMGMAFAMLISSLNITPMGMLSRAVCGIRGKTLIINLPGSVKAATECLTAISSVIPHAVDLILDRKVKVAETHMKCGTAAHRCSHEQDNRISLGLENVTERCRESPYPMISVESAVKILCGNAKCRETESITAQAAYGRVLAVNIYSTCNLPPFRASIKDGYAVLASDGKGTRHVLGGSQAGHELPSGSLTPGTCVRVNTGAPVPEGTTAVVQVEDTRIVKKTADGMEEELIEITTEPKEGQDIRPIGCDIEEGSLVLKGYTRIGAAEMGLLAACGCKEVTVIKVPSLGVLSTGDELQDAGEPLLPGHVYDSNKVTLISIFRENGYNPKDMGIAKDNKDSMIEALKRSLSQVDVLVTTGSVSMGDRDMLKPVLQEYFKATIHFGRVNMKPGKPTTFATCTFEGRKKYLVCLPGNPVSATVTSHLFVLPLLNFLCGNNSKPVIVKTKLTSSYNLDPRPEYARAILEWSDEDVLPLAYSTGNQISSKLLSCRNANALLMLPERTAEKTKLDVGDVVQAMLLGFNRCT